VIPDEGAAHGCGLNSRKRLYAFDRFTKEEQAAISGSVFLIRKIDPDTDKMLDIGENWRLNPAVLAAFFAFDNVVSDFNVAGGFV